MKLYTFVYREMFDIITNPDNLDNWIVIVPLMESPSLIGSYILYCIFDMVFRRNYKFCDMRVNLAKIREEKKKYNQMSFQRKTFIRFPCRFFWFHFVCAIAFDCERNQCGNLRWLHKLRNVNGKKITTSWAKQFEFQRKTFIIRPNEVNLSNFTVTKIMIQFESIFRNRQTAIYRFCVRVIFFFFLFYSFFFFCQQK